ncbi:MAG TPA: lipase maturation factor family protein [Verrucomicrobiae bacterium]|nr:lipase maturation factor family protein [Verrucomicrobiae bacterium]
MRVSSPPAKPLLVFDGDCNFCRYWIARWQRITGDRIDYLPFQDPAIAERFPEIPRARFEQAVQLIETEGRIYSAAEAVFRSLAYGRRWPLWAYRHVPGVAPVTELAYRLVASHRTFFSFLTRLLWGRGAAPSRYVASRWLFLRLIGLIYIIAFVSLGVQIIGLVGHNGIVPADQMMPALQHATHALGWKRFFAEPTLCWYRADDAFLRLQCSAGIVLGLLVLLGVAQKLSLFLLWVLYLSLTIVCRVFLSYQWDVLLLETGLLAIIFAPTGLRPASELRAPISATGFWLLRWLLFRLMLASGCVKLLSGDPTWRNLTALNYHYQTQPLPTWIGWYAHQLPQWWHKGSVVVMYGIELVLPFFIFMPRRLRLIACWAFIFLQLAIGASGNYGFFNLLAIALCVLLMDDVLLWRLIPRRLRPFVTRWTGFQNGSFKSVPSATPARSTTNPGQSFRSLVGSVGRIATTVVAILILIVSSMLLLAMFRLGVNWPRPLISLYARTAPFRSINNYGLFAVMTTTRPEIVVEGSNDGHKWEPYEFRWKPGDLKRRPGFVEPHQPRVDWQMWFAALGDYQENPWFMNFCYRLLQGSPEVIRLLEKNPFPQGPPQYIRAVVYEYKFTDPKKRAREGTWWSREYKGLYCPTLSRSRVPPL